MAADLQKLRQSAGDDAAYEQMYQQDAEFKNYSDYINAGMSTNGFKMNAIEQKRIKTDLLDKYYSSGKKKQEINLGDIANSAQEKYDDKENFMKGTLEQVADGAKDKILETAENFFTSAVGGIAGFMQGGNPLQRARASFGTDSERAAAEQSLNAPGFDVGDIAQYTGDLIPAVGALITGAPGAAVGAAAGAPAGPIGVGAGAMIGGAATAAPGAAGGEAIRMFIGKLMGLQQDQTMEGAVDDIGEAAVAGAFQEVGGQALTRIVGPMAGAAFEKIAGLSKGTLGTVARNPAGVKQASKAIKSGEGALGIVQEARDAVGVIKKSANDAYQLAEEKILAKHGATKLSKTPIMDKMRSMLMENGIFIEPIENGAKLDFSSSAFKKSPSVNAVKHAYEELRNWKDFSPLGIRTLRQRVQDIWTPAIDGSRSGRFVTEFSNFLNDYIAGSVDDYAKMINGYSSDMQLLDSLESRLKSPSAEGMLSQLFGRNKTELRGLMKKFGDRAGKDIVSMVEEHLAAEQIAPLLSKGLLSKIMGGSAITTGLVTSNPGAILGGAGLMAATSPRLAGNAAAALGRIRQAIGVLRPGEQSAVIQQLLQMIGK